MSSVYRFGPHTLRPGTRTLETSGQPVALGARAYDVLLALVERRDRIVTKNELLDVVWPDVVVEENNLQVQVSALRKALGTGAIATIPGRGYQFVLLLDEEKAAADRQPRRDSEALAEAETAAGASGLFGRANDLLELAALARSYQIVSVVGPGGVGKTVLARALLRAYPSTDREAYWVELGAVSDAAQMVPTLAAALALRLPAKNPQAALIAAVADRKLMIVLDNAEHLVDAVGKLIGDLRVALPEIRFIVTSQAPLGIHDEHVYRLEPLQCPEEGAPARSALGYGAVALFVARATRADRRFELTDENAEAVTAICRQLDGTPLAIELAAARVRELGLATLRESLAQRFRMLTSRTRTVPVRQQSLLAALDWSHSLLDDEEQTLFRRLAVFANGFALKLALAVSGVEENDWETIDRLAALAERSLVSVSEDEPPRYGLPETMRAYALEKLQVSGEEHEIRLRHAKAVRAFFAQVKAEGRTISQSRDAERELDNARESFRWAREQNPALAIELATLAARFTVFGPRRAEALSWLAGCESLVTNVVPRAIRADWWTEFARFRLFNRHPDASGAARRALEIYRLEGDDRGLAQALSALVRSLSETSDESRSALGDLDRVLARHPEWPSSMRCLVAGTHAHAAVVEGDYEAAVRFHKEEASFAAAMGSPHLQNAAETNLIALLRADEQYDEVRVRAQALLARLKGSNETANIAYASLHLLDALTSSGRLDEARDCAIRAWQTCRQLNLPLSADPTTLLVARQDRPRTAARLLGYTRAKYARLQYRMQDVNLTYCARIEAILRDALSKDELAMLISQGSEWSDDEAFGAAFESNEA